MKDLYRRLGVDDGASEALIREASSRADGPTREAAELILLDPRRRAVYDRNRRVLVTVGTLRSRLGLNLTRFWPKSQFGDFRVELAAVAPPPARRVDPMAVLWAFRGKKAGREGLANRGSGMVLAAGAAAVVVVLLVLAWVTYRAQH